MKNEEGEERGGTILTDPGLRVAWLPNDLSQYLKCFARLVAVGGHFRMIRKWRTSSIFVFCLFSREKIDINSEKCS